MKSSNQCPRARPIRIKGTDHIVEHRFVKEGPLNENNRRRKRKINKYDEMLGEELRFWLTFGRDGLRMLNIYDPDREHDGKGNQILVH